MHFGGAIGVGVTSDDERIMLDLTEYDPAKEIMDRLNSVMPAGLAILHAEDVPEGVKSPLATLNATEYRITFRCPADPETVQSAVDELLAAGEVKVVRKRDESKEVDIRPHILGIEVEECHMGKLVLSARLMAGSSGGARPQDLIQALADRVPGAEAENIHKVRQYAV